MNSGQHLKKYPLWIVRVKGLVHIYNRIAKTILCPRAFKNTAQVLKKQLFNVIPVDRMLALPSLSKKLLGKDHLPPRTHC